eukprot:scaffold141301_cov30-Tisochrysis_lutea.AAC.3
MIAAFEPEEEIVGNESPMAFIARRRRPISSAPSASDTYGQGQHNDAFNRCSKGKAGGHSMRLGKERFAQI